MTIIKDLIVINDSNFYLTKEDKTIKNEYNIIGKSYNKKEKYKTQETNYEISLEYVLNKEDKQYFFNLLNDNNYYLYKRKESFKCDLVYNSNITTIYVDINNVIFDNINIFNYDLDNRLYLLINNKKYSFYFDETYDYNLNGKYRLVDEISLNTSSNLNNTNAELLDICILTNNNIKFKFLTDEKYNLTFDIETINNIITSLSINNTITPNLIDELSYNELYALNKDILYTKLLKLNSNHYLLINIYNLLNNSIEELDQNGKILQKYNLDEKIYMYISYKKIYINNNNIIEKEEEFHSLIDFNNKFEYKNFGISESDGVNVKKRFYKHLLYNFIDFNVILDNNNEVYLTLSLSLQDFFNTNTRVYKRNLRSFILVKNKNLNNILLNCIEYLKFEINNDKLNIIDYKKQNIETLVDYKKYERDNQYYLNNIVQYYDLYQSNINSNIYIYNNLLYISNLVNNKIITNQYNKNNNDLKQINNNEIFPLNYQFYGEFGISTNINNQHYNYYYRAKEDDINYKIKNKSNYFNLSKNYSNYYNNENNLVESELINYNLNGYKDNFNLIPENFGENGYLNSIYSIQKVLVSNNKKIFLNTSYDANQYHLQMFNIYDFFTKYTLTLNNNNELKKITNVNGIYTYDLYIACYSKNHIKYYYNILNNKHYLFFYEKNYGLSSFENTYFRVLEYTYDDNQTILITNTNQVKIDIDYQTYLIINEIDKKIFDVYFDEINRKYNIITIFDTKNKTTNQNLEVRQIICLNEDLSINFKIEDTKELTY